MLRHRFIRNYHKQTKYEKERRALTADDQYFLKQTRPITDNAVKNLPKNQLDKFIDDVLNHKQLTSLLYSSNAHLEIKSMHKAKITAQRNFYTKHKEVKYDPHDFIRNRTIKEAYVQIKDEISKYKQEHQTYKKNLLKKNHTGYLKIKQQNKEDQQRSVKLLHQNRIDRYTRTFEYLTDKLLQEKINLTENEVTNGLNNPNTQHTSNEQQLHHHRQHTISSFSYNTNATNVNSNYNNNVGNGLYYCDTSPSYMSSARISFPKVKLDINNVYSRLYHNAVIPIKKQNSKRVIKNNNNNINNNNNNKNKKRHSIQLNLNISHDNSENDINDNNEFNSQKHYNNKIKFKLKSALKDMNNNGKEFTIKIDKNVYNNCFSKYSGGPEIYEQLKRRIELDNKKEMCNYNNQEISNEVDFYNLKLEDGNSFLHIVTAEGFPEMVRYFLEKGANVNILNSKGDTPLHIAVRNKNEEIIKLLIDFNAKIGICNNDNEVVYISENGKKKKYGIEKEYVDKQHGK